MKCWVFILAVLLGLGCATPASQSVLPTVVANQTAADIVRQHRADVYLLDTPTAHCTAFSIGAGLVVTAQHRVNDYPAAQFGSAALVDLVGVRHRCRMIAYDEKRDLAVLIGEGLPDRAGIPLWNSQTDGELEEASELIALGHPGYMNPSFTFDVGFYKGFVIRQGVRYLLSLDITSPGYSGGPIIDVRTGKLVGIQHAGGNSKVKISDINGVQDHWMTLAVSSEELAAWLSEIKSELEAK